MKDFVKSIFPFIVLFTQLWEANAQKQNNNWCFDRNAGINFNTTPPTIFKPDFDHSPYGSEVSATVSDRNTGDLLFYTDGYKIYDRNYNIMPNSYGIGNDTPRFSCHQGAVIVPHLSDGDKYYVFTLNDILEEGMLRYSIVDMKLNNGLGDVVPTAKATPIDSNFLEAMGVVKGVNCDLWLVVIKRKRPEIYAYNITKAGINTTPVISTFVLPPPLSSSSFRGFGLKISPNNKKICFLAQVQGTGVHKLALMDVNRSTGRFSNFGILQSLADDRVENYEFSSNSSYLFVIFDNFQTNKKQGVHQFDLTLPTVATIDNSKKTQFSPRKYYFRGGMELGPDKKIYVTAQAPQSQFKYIYTINNADLPYPAPLFLQDSLGFFSSDQAPHRLPTKVELADEPESYTAQKMACNIKSMTLSAPPGMINYQWQSGSNKSDTVVTSPGKYWVKSYNGCFYTTDTFVVDFLFVNLGADTAICSGDTITLTGGNVPMNYLWNTGDTTHSIRVSTAGEYTVTVESDNCTIHDTIRVQVHNPQVQLPADTALCKGGSAIISVPDTFDLYDWNNADNGPSLAVNGAGSYWLRTSKYGCISADTIKITIKDPHFDLGKNLQLCNGEKAELNVVTLSGSLYEWQDASSSEKYIVQQPGLYWVKVTNECGVFTDSIDAEFENCDCNLFVPSAFTPNGDGLNDGITALIDCNIADYALRIVNRFGEIVFESREPRQRWDGTYKGFRCDLGTYYFYLKVTGPRNKVFSNKGDITLIR